MSKRSVNEVLNKSAKVGASQTTKKVKHWSLGLLDSMKDLELIVKETKIIVVIKDKYPKAKLHYLILPHEDLSSIFKLNTSHISLLEEFGKIYKELVEENKDLTLRGGFHAIPSMHRLHMHVISNDMISPFMKTKIHWNTFTTKFFLPFEDVIQELKENGKIERISEELHTSLITTPLQCNQCSFKPKNMPNLKEHLLTHS